MAEQHPDATMLIWLPPEDLAHVGQLGRVDTEHPQLIFSSSLLRERFDVIPEELRATSLITYPHRLPGDMSLRMGFVKTWLQVRKLPQTNLAIQSKAFFTNWMMTGVLRMMGDDFYRDYFFDVIDMMNDETYAIVNYPRLSFGAGQRYALKGCYLVEVGAGKQPELIKRSPWVIH
jgi:hypothetical protein